MIRIIRRGSARSTISTVFDELANAIHGANMQWRAKSYAASVPSHMPKSHKAQKRVSKDDRRAMVESYVNRYRETHAGKFPSISDAQKQVGGNYYFIRKIVQELEYKFKISSSNRGNKNFLGKELPIVSKLLVKDKNMLTGGATLDTRTQCHPHAFPLNDVGDTSYKYLEVEEGLQTSEKMEFGNPNSPKHLQEHSDTDATQAAASHVRKHETKNVSHPFLVEAENDQEKLSSFKRAMVADHPNHNPYLDKHEKEISSTRADDRELPKKSTLWGNLKSFADGLVSMWRKM